ncbi:MAG: hypothetical protein AABZ53_12095 [Planctomycetota bacterium]
MCLSRLLLVGLSTFGGLDAARAQPDYDHNCVTDLQDCLRFMDDYSAARIEADLNLDGVVNAADFDAFSDSKAKPTFTYYWMVSTVWEPGRTMDTVTNLGSAPISRNAVIIYEQDFPKIPIVIGPNGVHGDKGIQLILKSPDGTYTAWQANMAAWMAAHSVSVPTVVSARVPAGFDGILCLDLEVVLPLRELIVNFIGPGPQLNEWDDAVAAINTPILDPAFKILAGWTAPPGAVGWADLNSTQRVDLSSKAYRAIALDFYLRTVEGARAARPAAKIGFYGMPSGAWPFYDDARRALNDLLQPMWAQCDVLMPSLYQLYWTTTTPLVGPCPDAVNTPAANATFFASAMEESRRIQTITARPGQIVIPFVWWHYKSQAGQCSPDVNPTLLVNDTNLKQLLTLPWWHGADGLAIWGAYARLGPANPLNWLDDSTTIGADFRARWSPIISRIACPR